MGVVGIRFRVQARPIHHVCNGRCGKAEHGSAEHVGQLLPGPFVDRVAARLERLGIDRALASHVVPTIDSVIISGSTDWRLREGGLSYEIAGYQDERGYPWPGKLGALVQSLTNPWGDFEFAFGLRCGLIEDGDNLLGSSWSVDAKGLCFAAEPDEPYEQIQPFDFWQVFGQLTDQVVKNGGATSEVRGVPGTRTSVCHFSFPGEFARYDFVLTPMIV